MGYDESYVIYTNAQIFQGLIVRGCNKCYSQTVEEVNILLVIAAG